MGKIKHTFVKRSARKVYELNPDEFSDDFSKNKKVLDEKGVAESKSIRNKMAGYMVRIVNNKDF